jgi:thioredoxin-like negative regulator of GroEL
VNVTTPSPALRKTLCRPGRRISNVVEESEEPEALAVAVGVGNATFEKAVLERSFERPVVVVFASARVSHCRIFEAALQEEIARLDARIELAEVDVDAKPELAERYRLQLIPTVKAFRDGEEVAGFVSARPREALASFLDSLLGPGKAGAIVEELRAEREWREVVAALDEDDHERAFELLLDRAEYGDAAQRERVRELMVALFAQLGREHPLTELYRRRLASVLY